MDSKNSGNVLMNFVLILVVLIAIVIFYFKRSFNYWKHRGIPYAEPAFPFGNIRDLVFRRCTYGEAFGGIYNKFRDSNHKLIGGFFFARPMLIVKDLDLIKNVLARDFEYFNGRGMYVNEKVDPLTAHLFALEGAKWRNLRTKLSPAFSPGKMKMMFQTLVECSDGLVRLVEESGRNAVEIKETSARFTTDVIGSCAFGLDCNSLKGPYTEFRYYGMKFFNPNIIGTLRMLMAFAFPSVLKIFNTRALDQDVSNFFLKVVKDTMRYREDNKITRNDFLSLLLQLKNTGIIEDDNHTETINDIPKAGVTLTDEQITAQCFLFFLAGYETASSTLTFCLYELVKNITIQDKLRQEIIDVLAQHNGKITYEAIMCMKYMEQVINETLRKYTPLGVLNRICIQDYNLPEMNVSIPKGQPVLIPVQAIHSNPKYYPNPDKFDPERFSEESKKTRHPYTFIPFGEGPRMCIGIKFGVMEIKVALTVLLKNFKFTLNEKTIEPLTFATKSFINIVENGVYLNATKI